MKTFTNRIRLSTILSLLLLLWPVAARAFYNPATGRWLSRDPIHERGGNNLYAFVCNNPLSRFDSRGLLTATGGTPHTSLVEHNNYLSFMITCPPKTKLAVVSVDYSGALSGLYALGLDNDMLSDAFGGFSGASDLGGLKGDPQTPNCNGTPVEVDAYMRTRLSNQIYLDALWVEFHSADGFPHLKQTAIVGAYVAGTVINYHCKHCDCLK